MFFHRGRVRRDSDDERAFMALSISMTTRMESETVEAALAEASEKMWQPIEGKMVLQLWKWVCINC
jgi:hypothetical protein